MMISDECEARKQVKEGKERGREVMGKDVRESKRKGGGGYGGEGRRENGKRRTNMMICHGTVDMKVKGKEMELGLQGRMDGGKGVVEE